MLRGMEELIEEKTGINTMTADDPMKVVAIGTGEYVEFMGERKGIQKTRVNKIEWKRLKDTQNISFTEMKITDIQYSI